MLPLLLALAAPVQAADWLSLQGLEPADPDKARLRAWGFVQVTGEGVIADPVTGLENENLQPYNGELAVFNTVGSQGQPTAMALRRVRIGVRGNVPDMDWVHLFGAVELGQNGVTTAGGEWSPALMDASITLASPWNVHLRAGQFKVPTADEVLEAVHMSADLVQFTVVTRRLLMERYGGTGAFSGPATGFRDVGVQLFGSHLAGPVELSWAALGSNGTTRFGDEDPGKDLTLRAQASWLLDGPRRSPTRQELGAWAWAQTGSRAVGPGETATRTRAGAGLQLHTHGLRLRSEAIWAQGVLNTGMAPPFAGGTLQLDPTGEAWGVTGLASYRFATRWELGASYAHLDSLPEGGPQRRIFDETTAFAQLHLHKRVWVNTNLAWRTGRAPEGSADATAVLDTMGPYVGVQLTAIGG